MAKEKKPILVICIGVLLIVILMSGCIEKNTALIHKDDCSNLDETECFLKEICQSAYGPSCDFCEDIQFNGCSTIDPKYSDMINKRRAEIEKVKKSVLLCRDTGGDWIFKENCNCKYHESYDRKTLGHLIFDEVEGCISQKDYCEKLRGLWKSKNEGLIEEECNQVPGTNWKVYEWGSKCEVPEKSKVPKTNERCYYKKVET
ncbi:MAG: hypothetical protein ABH950_05430 [Candidatus Altiarchaeota archaeon]